MNGHLQLETTASPNRDAHKLWRLGVALAVSSLLHLIIIFLLAYVGRAHDTALASAAIQGHFVLSATLRLTGEGAVVESPLTTENKVAKDIPLPSLSGEDELPVEKPDTTTNYGPAEGGTAAGVDNNEHIQLDRPYYLANQLTTRPQALTNVELDAPEILFSNVSGTIIFSLWINESGNVVKTSVETNDLPEPTTAAIIDAFRKMLFKPGEIDGRVVGSIMKIEASVQDYKTPVH